MCLGMAEFFKGKTQSSVETLSRGEGERGDCSLKVMPKSPQLPLNMSLCSASPLPKIKCLLHENNCKCSLASGKKAFISCQLPKTPRKALVFVVYLHTQAVFLHENDKEQGDTLTTQEDLSVETFLWSRSKQIKK